MPERPILFSRPMVQAIRDGRKTQTRRVVVPGLKHPRWTVFTYYERSGLAIENGPDYPDGAGDERRPPAVAGDTLWVREAHFRPEPGRFLYAADMTAEELAEGKRARAKYRELAQAYPGGRLRPGIHLPRSAARLFLRVRAVRVEPLQAITEADAIAEGLGDVLRAGVPAPWDATPILAFRWLWDSLNAARGYGWAVNPWVWVLEFDRVRT